MSDGPDIWTRLAKLDSCCHVSMNSLYVTRPDGSTVREWEVNIQQRGEGHEPAIRVRSETLVVGILEALAQADRRGWPGIPGPPLAGETGNAA